MYTRITTYRMNPEKFDEALTLAEELKPEIMEIPGIKYWFNNGKEDGSCVVIAIYESEEAAKSAASALFTRFAEYMESEPQQQGYPMLLHGANP